MNQPKRIWKTAVLAITVTLVFAIFAFNFEDWTNGISSEFVVYGQTSIGGGTCTCTGTSNSTSRIIPQIAVGSFDSNITKYTTVIEIVNTGTTTVTLSGGLHTTAGAASTLSLKTNLTAPLTVDHLALSAGTLTLAAGRVLVLTADTAPTGTVNWAKIVPAGGTIAVSAYFEIRDVATNILYSRVGVAGSHQDMKKFVIPRVRNTAAGTDVGFALVNTSSTATATVTATLKDAAGATVAVKAQALIPGQQIAVFPSSFFAPLTDAAGTNYHYMVFESTSSTIAATALAIEGASLASFAVERLE